MVTLEKVVLEEQGARAPLSLEKGSDGFNAVRVRLSWTSGVDLDLHAYYRSKEGEEGHIYFARRGGLQKPPYIRLDEDAGVGNRAGANEENIVIGRLDHLESVVIATHIFRFFGFLHRGDNFAKYDGRVLVAPEGRPGVEVPLSSSDPCKWYVIAKIDNSGETPHVVNINRTQSEEPDLAVF